MQVVINQESKQIICLNFGPGHCQDFTLKKSNVHFHPSIVYKIVAIKG